MNDSGDFIKPPLQPFEAFVFQEMFKSVKRNVKVIKVL